MPERGLEPPPSYLDKNLNLARLPIPPLGQVAAAHRSFTDNATNGPEARKACRWLPKPYSTVTLLAKLRGLSTSQPRSTAMW